MKPARVLILTVAVVSAGLAGLLALNLTGTTVVQADRPVVEREPTLNVLVAAKSLSVGSRITADALRWMAWPKDGIVDGFITDEARPEAMTELTNAVVRLPLLDGEPIRPEKIADASSKILSSLLPSGKRAVATEITVATSAGGFVLPNDRVDVIMVRRGAEDQYLTETVLSNVRVLAIDQQIEESPEGGKTVVGATATLELTPDQAQVITVAQQMAARLSLALRSVADAQEPDTNAADYLLKGDGRGQIQVIKSGSIVRDSGTSTSMSGAAQ